MDKFQPTRPLRGATYQVIYADGAKKISTHAPLAGRDRRVELRSIAFGADFNPRAPCGARRFSSSLRILHSSYFNPRAPCGARLRCWRTTAIPAIFQPTRPLRGATSLRVSIKQIKRFQPTRPLRGATASLRVENLRRGSISTHAPLAGRDKRRGK